MSVQPTNIQAKSVQGYSEAIQQQMQSALQKTTSNSNKGMPQNPAMHSAAQSSPMAQSNMNANAGGSEFEYNTRMGMPQQNGPAPAAGGQPQPNNGNHALQDYQMQLMLLEQQNKKRLLMARQEQDSMAHPTGVQGPNGGQFARNMSPQPARMQAPSPSSAAGDMQRGTSNIRHMGMSPNTNIAGRGSPQPGMMDPNNPQMRQMVMGPDGRPMMRAPSSHPMAGQGMSTQQMDLMRQQGMMPNGQMYPGGPQGPQGQMMPGQQPGQAGPPGQPPNMTPRPNNMPPPPAPTNPGQAGTQPSSPAQPAAPPTPNQMNKAKPGLKKAADNKKVGHRCKQG